MTHPSMREILNKLEEAAQINERSSGIPEKELLALAIDTGHELHTAFPEQISAPRKTDYIYFSESAVFFRAAVSDATFKDSTEFQGFKKNPEFKQIMKTANARAAEIHPGARLKFASLVDTMDRSGTTFRYEFVITVDKRKDPQFAEAIEFFKTTVPNVIKKIAAEVAKEMDTENAGFEIELHSMKGSGDSGAYRLEANNMQIKNDLHYKVRDGEMSDERRQAIVRTLDIDRAMKVIERRVEDEFKGFELAGKQVETNSQYNKIYVYLNRPYGK